MPEGDRSYRRLARGSRRALLLAVATALAVGGAAMAAGGLLNPSFESGLGGWSAGTIAYDDPTLRSTVYEGAEATPVCEGEDADKTRVCLVEGSDDFTVVGTGGSAVPVSVSPYAGSRMVRLGGPFTGAGQRQLTQYRPQITQSFVVDPSDPVVRLAYNIYSWDGPPFDDVELRLTVSNEAGAQIAAVNRQAPMGSDQLHSTGWQLTDFDLTAYAGQTVFLRVSAGGTIDESLATWAYIDGPAGAVNVPTPPPSPQPVVAAPAALPCAGLSGRKLRRCRVDLQVERKCGTKQGKRRKACAKRVRAVAKCKALPKRTRRQRAKRARCLAEARQPAAQRKGSAKRKGGKG